MNNFRLLLSFMMMIILSGCVAVEPWERANFAKDHMLIEPHPLDASFTEHAFFSREGTSGGFGVSGGGCGCN